MRGSRPQLSGALVVGSLCLVVLLANLGLTIHSGHHSLGSSHGNTVRHSLAGHTEPDPTLHMDSLSEVRTLTCPGCLLQNQISGLRLSEQRGGDRLVVGPDSVATRDAHPISATRAAQPARGPPPVDQV